MNKEEITKILNKFDKVLENYELDKKFGQLSVDSIYHLFPGEMITIKDYIKQLKDRNKALEETIEQLYRELNTSNMSEEEWLDYAIEYNLEQLEKRCLDE